MLLGLCLGLCLGLRLGLRLRLQLRLRLRLRAGHNGRWRRLRSLACRSLCASLALRLLGPGLRHFGRDPSRHQPRGDPARVAPGGNAKVLGIRPTRGVLLHHQQEIARGDGQSRAARGLEASHSADAEVVLTFSSLGVAGALGCRGRGIGGGGLRLTRRLGGLLRKLGFGDRRLLHHLVVRARVRYIRLVGLLQAVSPAVAALARAFGCGAAWRVPGGLRRGWRRHRSRDRRLLGQQMGALAARARWTRRWPRRGGGTRLPLSRHGVYRAIWRH
mmetsp:Transcript_12260/g.35222  ORF Transcript_12260/g.35222 Transcript_12260/m.35222 type:complete len:274 (+) Transcript_12260:589-1410(+)